MNDFDRDLKAALAADPIDERGYYREALGSFRGRGSGLRVLAWIGILAFSAGTLYCFYKMLTVETLDWIVRYGVGAVVFSQAQIALKLWFNMQLNRRALAREIGVLAGRMV